MSVRRTLTRFGAPLAAAAAVTLVAAAPASAHVTVTPSDATAGAFTVLTVSVPHGCDGSPTTRIEMQIPEQILSVTPTRNPFYEVETKVAELDEPVTDEDGNEVTERTGSVVYTAERAVAGRDARHLRAVLPGPGHRRRDPHLPHGPDLRQGRDRLDRGAGGRPGRRGAGEPGPRVRGAARRGVQRRGDRDQRRLGAGGSAATTDDGSDVLSWVALGVGALGLLVGGAALARSRKTA